MGSWGGTREHWRTPANQFAALHMVGRRFARPTRYKITASVRFVSAKFPLKTLRTSFLRCPILEAL